MKTPAPQRAAGRKKLAAAGQALGDGSFVIPNVDYLRRAIRSVGRAPASKRPALKALIRKRATELKATNAPGVKGTWPFTAANDTTGAAGRCRGPRGGAGSARSYPVMTASSGPAGNGPGVCRCHPASPRGPSPART